MWQLQRIDITTAECSHVTNRSLQYGGHFKSIQEPEGKYISRAWHEEHPLQAVTSKAPSLKSTTNITTLTNLGLKLISFLIGWNSKFCIVWSCCYCGTDLLITSS